MTASLQEKNGKYYVVLAWQQQGVNKQKWISTKLPVQGNKKRAEDLRVKYLVEWSEKVCESYEDMPFGEYLEKWLDDRDRPLAPTTYNEYKRMITRDIAPYFNERKIRLQALKAYHIKDFYKYKQKINDVSANTIAHYHACIHAALKHAVKYELLKENPAGKVELPRIKKFKGDFYTKEEVEKLLHSVRNTKIELPIYLVCWFGFRRGEVCGLRWGDVDFIGKTLSVNGTMVDRPGPDGKRQVYYKTTAKTESSLRTYPLTDQMVAYLKKRKLDQLQNRLRYGAEYNRDWLEYVCVDDHGRLVTPEYLSYTFPKFLEKNGLRKIRFHDLRHTCASLLLAKGAQMYDVKAWLGHDCISTTIDLYGHLQMEAKKGIANALSDTPELACING